MGDNHPSCYGKSDVTGGGGWGNGVPTADDYFTGGAFSGDDEGHLASRRLGDQRAAAACEEKHGDAAKGITMPSRTQFIFVPR